MRSTAPRSARVAPPAGDTRLATKITCWRLLLRHRAICQQRPAAGPEEDLADARNRELLRVLQDPVDPFEHGGRR